VSTRRGGGRSTEVDSTRPTSRGRASSTAVLDRDDLDELEDEPAAGAGRSRSRRTIRRVSWPLVLTVLVCVTLALGVFPTRTYLERKQEVALAQQQVDNLTRENDDKQARVDQLQTDEEIEAIARGEYQLVMPGEEAYEVLPPPQEPVQLPDGWPFEHLERSLTPATP
jgi:cell division protein FtsB